MSQLALANRALSLLGTRSNLTSLAAGQSTEGDQIMLNWDFVRDEVLRGAPWDFAKKFATATLLKSAPGTPENVSTVFSPWDEATMPPRPWKYTYEYPDDCLRLRYIQSENVVTSGVPITSVSNGYSPPIGLPIEFSKGNDTISAVEQTVIWTNAPGAIFCYTRRITDDLLWDSQFCIAFEHALAAKINMALTGKLRLQGTLIEMAQNLIMQARITDGNEGVEVYDSMPDWLVAREGIPSITDQRTA